MFFVFMALIFRFDGGDVVLFGSTNKTEEGILSTIAHSGIHGATDYWNEQFFCADAHPSGVIICCANRCAGVFAVYRFSFALCLFFAFLTLCTVGTTKFGARVHRGFWFLKLFVLIVLICSTVAIDNDAMYTYREVARYTSFIFKVLQIVLLIDFGYKANEYLVELDEASDSDSKCSWRMVLLGGSVLMYALSITMWVLEAQWFGGDGCGPQQTIISLTIICTIALSIVSVTKYCPHGTLFTSAIVTVYATYEAYSALASHPDGACNPNEHTSAPDLL